jgi:hypothetical protein
MRRGWQALCIGLGIQVLLTGLGILTRTPQIPGQPAVLSPIRIFNMPGFVFELLAADSIHITWSLHPVLLPVTTIVGNVLFYSLAAYFVLWLRSVRKSNRAGRGTAWFRTPLVRPVWLAVATGLAVAVILLVPQHLNFTRAIPNGEGGVTYTDAYPQLLMNLTLPGLALILLAINVTPVMWGSHPLLAQAVVTTGNFLFYSAAAYMVLRLTGALSTRWKQR